MKRLLSLLALVGFAFPLAQASPPPALTGQEKSLFDGKTLEGWESPSPELWSVRDGCLTGGDGVKPIPHNDFLCTKARYGNFVLRLKIKLFGDPKTGMINSGIQIRTERKPQGTEVSGYQCDYGETDWYGCIYDEGRRDKVLKPSDMAALRPVIHVNDWNDYVMQADGPRIQTWINGMQGVDFTETDPAIPLSGIIGIQIHGGGVATVQVKDVQLQELPASPAK